MTIDRIWKYSNSVKNLNVPVFYDLFIVCAILNDSTG